MSSTHLLRPLYSTRATSEAKQRLYFTRKYGGFVGRAVTCVCVWMCLCVFIGPRERKCVMAEYWPHLRNSQSLFHPLDTCINTHAGLDANNWCRKPDISLHQMISMEGRDWSTSTQEVSDTALNDHMCFRGSNQQPGRSYYDEMITRPFMSGVMEGF